MVVISNASSSGEEDASSSEGAHVPQIVVDADEAERGLAGGYRTSQGRPVEVGIHGFWREYKNKFDIINQIQSIDIDTVLTDYTPSVLYSKSGKVAVAPVLLNNHHHNKNEIPSLFVPSFKRRLSLEGQLADASID